MQATSVLFLTSYELVMSLIFGTMTIVLATKLLNRFVLSDTVEHFIRNRHQSGCLISASLICAVIYLTRGSVEQSTLALQSLVSSNHGLGFRTLSIALAYFVVFYSITLALSFLALFVMSKVYRLLMSGVDFDVEIEKHDNLGLSIFLSVILFGLVSFVDKPINHLLGSLVFHEYLGRL